LRWRIRLLGDACPDNRHIDTTGYAFAVSRHPHASSARDSLQDPGW